MTSGSRSKLRTVKAEQARQTRQTIVTAATRLFLSDGFVTTTMAQIAAEAGVAVQTLYLAFRSKTAILSAAFDLAIAGDDEPVPLLEREWMQDILANPDGPTALADFVTASTAIIVRATPLYMVIRSAAADPDVADVLEKNKRERYKQFAITVEALATKTGFSPRLSGDQAAAIVYAVQSEDSYALFTQERGWTSDQWSDWTLRTLRAELFPFLAGG